MAITKTTPRQKTPTISTANTNNNENETEAPKRKQPENTLAGHQPPALVLRTPDRTLPHSPFINLSPTKYVKTVRELGGAIKIAGKLPHQLSLKIVAGGTVCLVYVDEFGSHEAAYSRPLTLATDISVDREDQSYNHQKYRDFIEEVGILSYLPRRISKDCNQPKLFPPSPKDGKRYSQHVYLVHLEDKSKESIKALLTKIKDFMIAEEVFVELRVKFDETNYMCQALDHYIEDKYVLRIAQKLYRNQADYSFFEKNPSLRGCFFSTPYPLMADELGYPIVTPEDLSPNIDQEVAMAASPQVSPNNLPMFTSPNNHGKTQEDAIPLDMTP